MDFSSFTIRVVHPLPITHNIGKVEIEVQSFIIFVYKMKAELSNLAISVVYLSITSQAILKDEIRMNFVKADVFFQTLNVVTISQNPLMDVRLFF